MKRLVWIAWLLAACDGGGGVDAGMTDAGREDDAGREVDGGRDAGMPDGGRDAGDTDAGPPTPDDTGPMVEAEVTMTEAAIMDLTPAERIEGALLDIDAATSAIDALIGEKGLGTLSLDAGAVRAFADVRTAGVILAQLDRSIASFSDSPESTVMALRARLQSLRDAVQRHRDALARLLIARRDAFIPGGSIVDRSYVEHQSVFGTTVPARLAFAAEARAFSLTDAQLAVACSTGGDLTVRVYDAATETELASHTTGGLSASISIPLPYDETTMLEVVIEGIPRAPMFFLECDAQMQTRRRFRAAPMSIPGSFPDAVMAFRAEHGDTADAVFRLCGSETFDVSVCDAVDAHLGAMSDMVATLLAYGTTDLPFETIERIRREATYMSMMTDTILASPQLSAVEAAEVRADLTATSAALDALIAEL
jgi:hypothetical protein